MKPKMSEQLKWRRQINMEHVFEFKHITVHYTQDMMEEIKQLFIEYSLSLEVNLDFQNFETELNTLPGKYVPPAGALNISVSRWQNSRLHCSS